MLDAWVEQNVPTWAASSAYDNQSRVRSIKKDPIVTTSLARLSVADVERWHTRLRNKGMADAGMRNLHGVLASRASPGATVGVGVDERRLARPPALVEGQAAHRAVVRGRAQSDRRRRDHRPRCRTRTLRIAAAAGARRAELASLRWTDVQRSQLLIDSAIEVIRHGDGKPHAARGGDEDGELAVGDARQPRRC